MLSGVRAVLLCGPTVLAFFTGGYFDPPRSWAGLLAWLLVALAVLTVPRPLLPGRPARLAVFGLAALAGWTLASATWAPIAGTAYHAGQIAVLYLGIVLAAALALRGDRVQRAVEPALAAGALIVIGYGLSERLLPGLLQFQHSISAEGRLEQPLTYWNAMGELAAIGLVLCARLTGDSSRAARPSRCGGGRVRPVGHGPLHHLFTWSAVRVLCRPDHAARARPAARPARGPADGAGRGRPGGGGSRAAAQLHVTRGRAVDTRAGGGDRARSAGSDHGLHGRPARVEASLRGRQAPAGAPGSGVDRARPDHARASRSRSSSGRRSAPAPWRRAPHA